MLRFLVLLGLCAAAWAQTDFDRYVAYKKSTLVSATEVVTIQQPASGARQVRFESAAVYCSAACTFTLEHDGTAATTSALTPLSVSAANTQNAAATAWSSSDAGSANPVEYAVGAGSFVVLDLTGYRFSGNGTTKNLTIRIASVTATVYIYIKWREQ